MPACTYRRPPAFGLDSDVCGATAVVRFRSAEDTWLQQYACEEHRVPERHLLFQLHPYENITEEDL